MPATVADWLDATWPLRIRDRQTEWSELDRWRRQGRMERLDLVFSRDQSERRYVQQRIGECAEEIRRWIADGAAIYVCGSLQGMAPGANGALTDVLGADMLETLAATGRYRRDVH